MEKEIRFRCPHCDFRSEIVLPSGVSAEAEARVLDSLREHVRTCSSRRGPGYGPPELKIPVPV